MSVGQYPDLSCVFQGLTGRDALLDVYRELYDVIVQYLPAEDLSEVLRAAEYGAQAHEGQLRQSGGPYFTHPITVCKILAEQRFDLPVLQAALLHDVLEDTAVTRVQMAEAFGDEVTSLVDGVSKLDHLTGGAEHVQAESFKKMFIATTHDPRVILIKLADRLHNMRTLGALRPDKRRRKALETLDVYASIAGKLGLFYSRVQLEDLAFSHLYPWRYAVLQKRYMERFHRNDVLDGVREELLPLLKDLGVKASIGKRQRHLWGLYQRMKRKHNSFSAACRTIPIRIITDTVDNCYRILGALHGIYRPVSRKFEDFIAAPKSNGYRSLHTSVLMHNADVLNVQIRTQEMHTLAETGIIAVWHQHLKDRSVMQEAHNVQAERYMRDWLSRLKDVQNITHDPLEFYDAIKKELSQGGVSVYSPRGEVFDLPHGATPVDLAYEIHTKLGNECIGARVNGEQWPLYRPLENGQTVEIIRDDKRHPEAGWLRFVVTAKAKAAIRHYLRHLESEEAVAVGKRLLDIALRRMGSGLVVLSDDRLAHFLKAQGITERDLFVDIGLDKRQPALVAAALLGGDFPCDEGAQVLCVHSVLDAAVHFGDCCYPLPYEPILGHVKSGVGVKIHRRNCVRAQHSDIDDWIRVAWAEKTQGLFTTELKILVEDRPRMIANITHIIGEQDGNIIDFQIAHTDHNAQQRILMCWLQVRDRSHLAGIVRQLRHLHGVVGIQRV